MIHGIGSDIVHVPRIQILIDKYGERFACRILASSELEKYRSAVSPAHFLSKRFAAKEAVVKAIGTGMRQELDFRDITIEHDPLGKPLIQYHDQAAKLIGQFQIAESHITISDEQDYALAFVVLLKHA